MSEDKNINVSVVPKFAETALENVLDKPSKSISETFSDIWYLVLGGALGQMAEKRKMKYAADLEIYKKKIEEEIEKISESNRCVPDIQLIGKALEESKYCADKEELRNMFAKIVAGSINKQKKNDVLPEYITILGNMTKIAANDIMYLNKYLDEKNNQFPLADISQKCKNIYSDMEFTAESKKKLEQTTDVFWSVLHRNICGIDKNVLIIY